MSSNLVKAFSLVVILSITGVSYAQEYATAKDAESMVGRVVKALEGNKDAVLKEINAKDPKWAKGDLYALVMIASNSSAPMLAHGANAKLVDKDMIDLTDPDGKSFVREMQSSTLAKGKSWTDYKFMDPVTKKVLPKSIYCEKATDMIVCAGIYKR